MLIAARTIALDSSHWAKWMRDAFAADAVVRRQARGFAEEFLKRGFTPLFSWHHLQELLAIEDARLAADRLRFIREMPFLSWIGAAGEEGLGSIVDVMAAEAAAAYPGASDADAVRVAARPRLLRSGAGEDFVPDHPMFLPWFQKWARSSADQARTITAIAPFPFLDPNSTLGELLGKRLRPADEVAHAFAVQRATLAREIKAGGDRRITDPDERAAAFIEEVAELARGRPASAPELVRWSLKLQGVDADEVHPGMTMAEVNRLCVFRAQLKAVAPLTGIPFELLKRRARPELMPHRLIGDALHAHGQRRSERPGSDLNDGYLAALAAYADILCFDKRTAEDFRRALAKKPMLERIPGRIEKLGHYRDILERLPE